MTAGETLKKLITAENYAEERIKVSDSFIEMAKTMFGDFVYIKEKEENYQKMVKFAESLNNN